MNELVKPLLEQAKDHMAKSIEHIKVDLQKIRAGKANPQILDGVLVDYYGNPTPLNQVANINVPDAKTITIQPWEKNLITEIEKAIVNSNIGVNPTNDGSILRINVPPPTEERRKELIKQAKAIAEHTRVSIRNVRKEINDKIKALKNKSVSEDEVKDSEAEMQKLTDDFIRQTDKILENKEKDIMLI